MHQLHVLSAPVESAALELTFPAYRPKLAAAAVDGPVLAVGAEVQGQLAGLALGEIVGQGAAVLLSLCVRPQHRGHGVGTALLGAIEVEMRRRRCRTVEAAYTTGKETTPALERILQKTGWSAPQMAFLLARGRAERIAQLPWLDAAPLPPDFQLFPWGELTGLEHTQLLHEQQHEGWYPDFADPFADAEGLEPTTSLGLRRDGRVVGWQVNHRLTPMVHRFTKTWVRPELMSAGRAISLIAESLKRYLASGIPETTVGIHADNTRMVRFFRRRIAPVVDSVVESRTVAKQLGPAIQ